MWLLSSPGTTLDGTHHWLQPGKEYLVGRSTEKQPWDFYLDQKTISRQHLKISIELRSDESLCDSSMVTDQSKAKLPRSFLILEDLKSKHHTYVNDLRIEGIFRPSIEGTQRFTIKLGKSKGINSTLILEWKPLIFCYSESQSMTKQLILLVHDTEIVITPFLVEGGMYLKGNDSSTKLISALALGIPAVTISFLESLIAIIKSDRYLLQKDFYGYFPKYKQYLADPRYEVDLRRRTIFQGIAFLFCEKNKYEALSACISDAGGKSFCFDLVKDQSQAAQANEKLTADELYQFVKKVSDSKSYNHIVLIKYSYNVSQSIAEINNLSIMTSAGKRLGYKLTDPMMIFESVRDLNCSEIINNKIDKPEIVTPFLRDAVETPLVLKNTMASPIKQSDTFMTPTSATKSGCERKEKDLSLCTPVATHTVDESVSPTVQVVASNERPKGGIGARRRARAETSKNINIMNFLVKKENNSIVLQPYASGNEEGRGDSSKVKISNISTVKKFSPEDEASSAKNYDKESSANMMSSFPSPPPFGSSLTAIRDGNESPVGRASTDSIETPDFMPLAPLSAGKLSRRPRVTKVLENPLMAVPVSHHFSTKDLNTDTANQVKRRRLENENDYNTNDIYIKEESTDEPINTKEETHIKSRTLSPTYSQRPLSELPLSQSLSSVSKLTCTNKNESEDEKSSIQSKIRSNKKLQSEKFAQDFGMGEGDIEYDGIMSNLSLEEEFDVDNIIARKLKSYQSNAATYNDGVLRVYGINGDNGWNEIWNGRKNFKSFKKARCEKNNLIMSNDFYGNKSVNNNIDFDFDIEEEDENQDLENRSISLPIVSTSDYSRISSINDSLCDDQRKKTFHILPNRVSIPDVLADNIIYSDSSDNDPLFIGSDNLSDETFLGDKGIYQNSELIPENIQTHSQQPKSKRRKTREREPARLPPRKSLATSIASTPKPQWRSRNKTSDSEAHDDENERPKFNFCF
ncbi:hypothetical protein NADFUDRAFT_43123 [Nadsonia fulvescens var. elongata DSM 6958]|uniref:FHA domain-containing protein n=1 Tax=Nadsonia fulvescens var. elongata DSM 6958 TaxID=857566 RepID=A0A1E3PHI5_9ASCO|nr:hypothetical protein NADFUDRAFT_43123 [Nadsonia fulvescens var. elongata DSM 6958]